jgi:hypothetical protein
MDRPNEFVVLEIRAGLEFLSFVVASVAAYGAIAVIQQMRLERRAWLNVERPQFTAALAADSPVPYEMHLKNTGRTPGTIVSAHIKFVLAESQEAVEKEFATLDPVTVWGGVIPPDGSIRYPGLRTLSSSEVDLIQNRRAVLYVIGEWRYRDGLEYWMNEPIRRTRFCLAYEPSTPSQDTLRFCRRFNEMH